MKIKEILDKDQQIDKQTYMESSCQSSNQPKKSANREEASLTIKQKSMQIGKEAEI